MASRFIVEPNGSFMKNGFAVWYCENSSPDMPYPKHTHSGCSDLYYVVAGKLINEIRAGKSVCTEGDIVWIREKDEHFMTGEDSVKFYQINFAPAMARRFASVVGREKQFDGLVKSPMPPTFSVPKYKRTEMINMFKTLISIQYQPDSDIQMSKALFMLMADYFFADDSREKISPPESKMPPWLLDLIDKIERDTENEITVSELPVLCGRSHEHVARSFKTHLGTSPSTYIKRKRIIRAASILLSSDRKLLDIAFSSGFTSISYFYRLFKEEFNCSPVEYKRKFYSSHVPPQSSAR